MDPQHLELQNKQLDPSIRSIRRNQSFSEEAVVFEGQGTGKQDVVQLGGPIRRQQRVLANVQFLTLCWTVFLIGWNDGSTGPLVPRIREFYHVRGMHS